AQSLDEDTMVHIEGLLPILVERAPSGLPTHKSLVQTFEELRARRGVLGCDPRFVVRSAALAAESWRAMAKRICDAAPIEEMFKKSSLQELFNANEVGDGIGIETDTEQESDVEVCGVCCKYSECARVTTQDGDSEERVGIRLQPSAARDATPKQCCRPRAAPRRANFQVGAKEKGGAKEGKSGGEKGEGCIKKGKGGE
ncbi:unnamed protein product, partial [Prorocentrum cordatum]